MSPHPQPLSTDGLFRRAAPFVLAAAVGFLTVPLPPGRIDSTFALVTAVVLTAATVAGAVLVPWKRLPAWSQALVPLAYIPAVALLRQAEGGGNSGFAILLLLPVFWLALYGTRRELVISVLGVTAALVLPILLEGAPRYPASEWRRAILWTAVAPVVGFTVQALVAEVRRNAAEVSRERRRLSAILENLADGVIACDSDGRVGLVNQAARHLHSLPEDLPPHEQRAELFSLERPPAAAEPGARSQPLLRALGGETVKEEELMVDASDGRRHSVLASAQPIVGPEGQASGAVLVIHDVTERKEAERLKNEFFALVSHELRTPLTSILGYTEILVETEEDAESARLLAVVDRNARRLQRLVGDLLFIAQLEAGGLPLEPGRVDLAVTVGEVVDALEHRARDRSIELWLEAHAVPEIAGDADRLAQVFDNLIANAIKYTPEGGRVVVRSYPHQGHVVIEVEDTGIGISPAEQDHVYDRFFRASTATDRVIQGVGLGLAVVKAIVEGHGGRIGLESEEGVGTTFRIELPLVGAPGELTTKEEAMLS